MTEATLYIPKNITLQDKQKASQLVVQIRECGAAPPRWLRMLSGANLENPQAAAQLVAEEFRAWLLESFNILEVSHDQA
jgi:hypothetical protein